MLLPLTAALLVTTALQSSIADRSRAEQLARAGQTTEAIERFKHILEQNPQLGRHLDDEWPVAVQAAQSLRTMQSAGLPVLHEHAARTDLAGLLARQMLWEASMPC